MTTEPRIPGKHAFAGACEPSMSRMYSQQTFSLGVFEWLPRTNGKGVKRGKVKVRVMGSVAFPEVVRAEASAIAVELDAGIYRGPKRVEV
jgi:hypothetical protein